MFRWLIARTAARRVLQQPRGVERGGQGAQRFVASSDNPEAFRAAVRAASTRTAA